MGKLTYTTQQVQQILDNSNSINSALPIEDGKIQKISFDIENQTIIEEGELAYDAHNLTIQLKTAVNTLQVGQEFTRPVINHTGSTLLDGRLVRITGYNGSYYEVEYADNSSLETAEWVGMLTSDIINDGVGLVTIMGLVHDQDTSLESEKAPVYLGTDGQWTTTRPSSPAYTRQIGFIGNIDATDGEIFVQFADSRVGDIQEELIDMNMPHGIPREQKDLIVMTYDPSTQTVTFNGNFYVYHHSHKHILDWTDETIVHADISGPYFVYLDFDVDDVPFLTASSTPWTFGDIIPLALIIFNNDVASTFWTGPNGKLLCERHGSIMDKATHKELHNTIGAWSTDSFTLSGYTAASGIGGLAENTFSIDSGTVNDEDNVTLLPTLADNNGVGNVYPVWYRIGSQWKWYTNNLPYLFEATNILYNPITAGSGALTQVTSNGDFINMWLVATPELSKTTGLATSDGFAIITGQKTHTTLASAQSASYLDLDLGGYPGQEVVPIYQIIMQRQNSYDDNGNVRIEQVRKITGTKLTLASGGVSPSVHNNLALRDAADAHPTSAITGLDTLLTAKVTGPASATDNAIPRFSGTTGKLIKGSTITISDTGDLTTAGTIGSYLYTGDRVEYGAGLESTTDYVQLRAIGTYENYIKLAQTYIQVAKEMTYQSGATTEFTGKQIPSAEWVNSQIAAIPGGSQDYQDVMDLGTSAIGLTSNVTTTTTGLISQTGAGIVNTANFDINLIAGSDVILNATDRIRFSNLNSKTTETDILYIDASGNISKGSGSTLQDTLNAGSTAIITTAFDIASTGQVELESTGTNTHVYLTNNGTGSDIYCQSQGSFMKVENNGCELISNGIGITVDGTNDEIELRGIKAKTTETNIIYIDASGNISKGAAPTGGGGTYNLTDEESAALVTTADGDKATNTVLAYAPLSRIEVFINGIKVTVGSTKACYFGPTFDAPRAKGSEVIGDYLWWNGTVAGYELATTDIIQLTYLK